MRFFFWILAGLSSLAWVGTAEAQIKATNRPIVKLTLEEAVVQGLQNNFRISIERARTEGVSYDLKSTLGVCDPVFKLDASHSEQNREGQFNAFTGQPTPDSRSEIDSVKNSVVGYLPTGLSYELGLSFDHRTGSFAGTPFDQYGANLGFTTLRQPLLRDFWIDSNRRIIRVARLNRDISDLDFETQVRSTVSEVRKAYFDLIAADEQIKASLSAHELASQLARDIRRRVEVGTLAQLEDKQAESKAQTELASYYQALHARNVAENRLKGLTTQKYRDQYEPRIEPAQKLTAADRRDLDLQAAWKNGLSKRPEYRASFFKAERERVNVSFAKNQIYPHLDLTGAYSRNGLDSSTAVPFNNADLGGAFHDIRRNSQPAHSYGVVFSVPFTMRTERANLKKAKVTQEQVLLELRELEQRILIEIDDSMSSIKSGWMRIQASASARELAEQALSAEQKKLESGVVSPSEVLKKQDELTAARLEELKALLDYNKALTDLDLQEGTILERNSVQIESLK